MADPLKFWIVFGDAGGTVQNFDTLDRAEEGARQLAMSNPGKAYMVFEPVSRFSTAPPAVTREAFKHRTLGL